MATLINGNGNCPVTAQQDADFFQGILGGSFVKMLPVGSEMAYTIADANTITLSDGECIDAEGRRIHIDVGNTDSFTIPTGTSGSTAYYIIGYYLSEDSDGNETASAFVEEVDSASSTLSESSLRDGASGKYVSLYRVTQESLAIASVEALFTVVTGLTGKLDGETLVTTLSEAVSAGEEAAPACSVIAEMYENFQDGCSTIAAALNAAGVTTASNASAQTMANSIAGIYNSRYNAGYNAAKVGNATAARVLNGYTFTNSGSVGATGSMNNWGSNTITLTSSNTATRYAGYYSNITVNAAGLYSNAYSAGNTAGYSSGYSAGNTAGYSAAKVGNATSARVLNGYTFTNSGSVGATGSMNNWGSNSVSMSSNTATLSAGYYSSISINAASRYSVGYNAGYNAGYSAGNTAGYNAKSLVVKSLGYNGASRSGWNLDYTSLTWNAANISGYANFTANNFSIHSLSVGTYYYTDAAGGAASFSSSISYNASSGTVTLSSAGAMNSLYQSDAWISNCRMYCYYAS